MQANRVTPMWEERLRAVRTATFLHTHCEEKWVRMVISHDIAEAIKGSTGHGITDESTFEGVSLVIEPTLPYGTAFLVSKYTPEADTNAC